jgi:ribosomal-protein-alanine N-acetyltransferase
MIVVHSEKVVLRHLEKTDLTVLTSLANNPKIAANLRDGFPHPYDVSHAERFFSMAKSYNPESIFVIEYDTSFAGMIGLHPQNDVYSRTAEIGYWLGEPFWNLGIMTTAVKLIVAWGWQFLPIVRIHTGVFSHNPASARVLEKAGFSFECEFKNSVFKNGKILNELRYSLLKP